MASLKETLAASAAITITSAAALANGSAAGCAAIDNTSNLYFDALLQVVATIASGSIASDQLINVWLAGSEDGTNWDGTNGGSLDNYVGTDAAVTLQSPSVYSGPFVIPTPNSNLTVRKSFWVAPFFGGKLPPKWGVIVENRTGLAFTAFSAAYVGLTYGYN